MPTGQSFVYLLLANFLIMSRKGKVLVAMSGGIDSTITALMLHNEGYEVVGITMKTRDYAASGGSKKETGCCNIDSFNDARQAAVEHGFAAMPALCASLTDIVVRQKNHRH